MGTSSFAAGNRRKFGHGKWEKKRGIERAVDNAVESLEQRMMLAAKFNTVSWIEQGPGVLTGVNTGAVIPASAPVGQNAAVGAVQAVATLPRRSSASNVTERGWLANGNCAG